MRGSPEVAVLRLGHRPGRDERMTTHVGLTARALGADRVVFANEGASRAPTVEDITDRFGGPFAVETTEAPAEYLADWEGRVVHLTMYGLPVQEEIETVRQAHQSGPLLAVVGAEKVPWDVYEAADWNLAVTNQPHSEVASLAVFLDRLFEGAELDREWEGADHEVVPQAEGKRVEESE
ncbi:MAG: tRNA (cytidine(56)-2'-O)-methyltransferase [Haloarculaceae archaeon]